MIRGSIFDAGQLKICPRNPFLLYGNKKRKLRMDSGSFRLCKISFMEMRQGEEYRIEKPAAYKAFLNIITITYCN